MMASIFHRVIDGFMIQGGGMDANMKEKKSTNAPIQNEADNGLKMKSARLGWQRTLTHIQRLRKFFINVKDNSFLNFSGKTHCYGAFGKVTEGMDIVNKIKGVPTGKYGFARWCTQPRLWWHHAKVIEK